MRQRRRGSQRHERSGTSRDRLVVRLERLADIINDSVLLSGAESAVGNAMIISRLKEAGMDIRIHRLSKAEFDALGRVIRVSNLRIVKEILRQLPDMVRRAEAEAKVGSGILRGVVERRVGRLASCMREASRRAGAEKDVDQESVVRMLSGYRGMLGELTDEEFERTIRYVFGDRKAVMVRRRIQCLWDHVRRAKNSVDSVRACPAAEPPARPEDA